MPFSIKNTTRKAAPEIQFEEIKDQVLGKKYELSLVFCGNALSRKLNSTYREMDRATNVLSFEITPDSGEIFINLNRTKSFSVLHLFIHALLHLKGMAHGRKMDSEEQRLLKKFDKTLNGSPNRSRN